MDRKYTIELLVHNYNQYINNELEDMKFIRYLIEYLYENQNIYQSNEFLLIRKVINEVGIPQYLGLLNFDDNFVEDFSLDSLSVLIQESSFHYFGEHKFHRKQIEILEEFKNPENRFFLTAPTTFGKTYIVYEVLRKMDYNNICLIFPTIALMSENILRIFNDETLVFLRTKYSVHTLSKSKIGKDMNLFLFTPERYLSFRDQSDINFDFVFVDEAYKLDNSYIIDEIQSENERDISYRLCIDDVCKTTRDILLAGPYLEFFRSDDERSLSFYKFLSSNRIQLLDYNEYELVIQDEILIKSGKKFIIDSTQYEFTSDTKASRFIELSKILLKKNENSLVYCSRIADTERYGRILFENGVNCIKDIDSRYQDFLSHLSITYGAEWILVKLLKVGIAVHHGLIPKYIQKEVIRLFNNGQLNILLCTTTITEGVNTTAKNMIVLHERKGRKFLRKFDARNIAGRAGRFTKHFKGRVFILQNNFLKIKNSEKIEGLKHKNYDLKTDKEESDLLITDELYLSKLDTERLNSLIEISRKMEIPDRILERYKSVNYSTKFVIYEEVFKLTHIQLAKIRRMVGILVAFKGQRIYLEGLDIIIGIIAPFFKDKTLQFLQEREVLAYVISSYLKTGYRGMLQYNIVKLKKDIDVAIRSTSKVVFRAFKYDFVKLLGIFDEIYKYRLFKEGNYESIEDVVGVSVLLNKLEYNALSEIGMLASDFGVSSKVLSVIENIENKKNLDEYEFRLLDDFMKYYDM
ncbi:helicase-related protein [Mycoplasmatota bacterium WC30]